MKLIILYLLIILIFILYEYYCKSFYIVKYNFLDKEIIEKINKIILEDKDCYTARTYDNI